jgi:hypothetical protein
MSNYSRGKVVRGRVHLERLEPDWNQRKRVRDVGAHQPPRAGAKGADRRPTLIGIAPAKSFLGGDVMEGRIPSCMVGGILVHGSTEPPAT